MILSLDSRRAATAQPQSQVAASSTGYVVTPNAATHSSRLRIIQNNQPPSSTSCLVSGQLHHAAARGEDLDGPNYGKSDDGYGETNRRHGQVGKFTQAALERRWRRQRTRWRGGSGGLGTCDGERVLRRVPRVGDVPRTHVAQPRRLKPLDVLLLGREAVECLREEPHEHRLGRERAHCEDVAPGLDYAQLLAERHHRPWVVIQRARRDDTVEAAVIKWEALCVGQNEGAGRQLWLGLCALKHLRAEVE
mmetsp:Transcript_28835/g.47760  ORF Transcript_28835/g.47760 Transcript_28835/m.47760 type:complete len:249 (-) Transcript_28835:348-1094(-)